MKTLFIRRIIMKKAISIVISLALVLMLVACGNSGQAQPSAPAAEKTAAPSETTPVEKDEPAPNPYDPAKIPKGDYVLAAGSGGGPQDLLAGAWAEEIMQLVPSVTVNVETGGAFSNYQLVNNGESDLGFSVTATSFEGWGGTGAFSDLGPMQNVRSIALSYPMYFTVFALESEGIRTVYDIAGHRYTPSFVGQTANIMAGQMLEVHGLSFDDCKVFPQSIGECTTMMKDRQIDVASWNLSLPQSQLKDLSSSQKLNMVEWGEGKLEEFIAKNPQYSIGIVPDGSYDFQEGDYRTACIVADILVNKDLDEALVYNMCKAYYDNLAKLADACPANAFVTMQNTLEYLKVPLHPGAAAYFEEQGLTIPDSIKPID